MCPVPSPVPTSNSSHTLACNHRNTNIRRIKIIDRLECGFLQLYVRPTSFSVRSRVL